MFVDLTHALKSSGLVFSGQDLVALGEPVNGSCSTTSGQGQWLAIVRANTRLIFCLLQGLAK
jgi:hypothetical protein